MEATIKIIRVSIPQALFDQAKIVAQQLNLPPNELLEIAIEHFVRDYQSQASLDRVNQTSDERLMDSEPIINVMYSGFDQKTQMRQNLVITPILMWSYRTIFSTTAGSILWWFVP
jgi:hypothetical protein